MQKGTKLYVGLCKTIVESRTTADEGTDDPLRDFGKGLPAEARCGSEPSAKKHLSWLLPLSKNECIKTFVLVGAEKVCLNG